MDFSEALKEMKKGYKMARTGWNGKGMWVTHSNSIYVTPFAQFGSFVAKPFLVMKTVDGEAVPWLASQTDMLAEDWQEVDGPRQMAEGMTWKKASALLNTYNGIARRVWRDGSYVFRGLDGKFYLNMPEKSGGPWACRAFPGDACDPQVGSECRDWYIIPNNAPEKPEVTEADDVIPRPKPHGVYYEEKPQPPLGVMPRWRMDEIRGRDLGQAIARYMDKGVDFPMAWIDELREIRLRRGLVKGG